MNTILGSDCFLNKTIFHQNSNFLNTCLTFIPTLLSISHQMKMTILSQRFSKIEQKIQKPISNTLIGMSYEYQNGSSYIFGVHSIPSIFVSHVVHI